MKPAPVVIARAAPIEIGDSSHVQVSPGPRLGFLCGRTGNGVCIIMCYSHVPREARPDAGMADSCGFSADVERVKGIEPSS